MLPRFKTFWKCNFPLKLSREVVVCIEGKAFSFISYSFYFIYFCFTLLLQKIITSLQNSGGAKASQPQPPPPAAAPGQFLSIPLRNVRKPLVF